jgi:RNA polymerase sigma factor (TIGR02999 family)
MGPFAPGDVTQLLLAWRRGEESALNRLVPLVYTELRHLAHRAMRAQPYEQSLQTTALINEAYLRLTDAAAVPWHDRVHFLAVCAQVMRRVLVDAARVRRSLKRGGGTRPVQFDEAVDVSAAEPGDLVRVDEALTTLERIDARKAKVVELRYFGGLTVEETADALAVSRETVLRDWRMARAWLKSEIGRTAGHG